jgi:hypothetical protein
MGLDVYVYSCPNRAAANAAEKEFERLDSEVYERIVQKYPKNGSDHLSDEAYAEWRVETARLRNELGIVDYMHKSVSKIEQPSSKYPDHYFKVGYFRSSYNECGINSYMDRLGLPDLNYIFDTKDEYEFTPDWDACKQRASEVLEKLRAIDTSVDVTAVRMNIYTKDHCTSNERAREIFMEELARQGGMESYENGKGVFWMRGMNVKAIIMGAEEEIISKVRGHPVMQPVAYVVYEKGDNAWYQQALEIVIETCDYVLAQPDKQNYYVHWSA